MWALLILLGVTAPSVWACQCIVWPSAKGAWEKSPVVFLGHVQSTDVEFDEFGDPAPGQQWQGEYQKVRVKVDEAFKGTRAGALILLEQPIHSCSPTFRSGDRRLFYLAPGEKSGSWLVHGCGRTRELEDAANDMLFLRALPWAAKRSRIAGRVSFLDHSVSEGDRRVRGLGGVRVRIRGEGSLVETVTNPDGIYEVYDLPAGSYRIELERPQGLAIRQGANDPEFVFTAAGGAEFSFVLVEDNVVAGRVVDQYGKPMAGVPITLESAKGDAESADLTKVDTKQDGTFELKDFPSGEFVLVANQSGEISGRTPFGAMYFPGTGDREKAERLGIHAGKHIESLILTVPKLRPTITVSGKVEFNDHQPAADAWLYLVDAGDGKALRVSTNAEGAFQVPLIAGQSVELQAVWAIFSRNLRKDCPGLALTRSNPYSVELKSQPLLITTVTNQSGIVLTLPGPFCQSP